MVEPTSQSGGSDTIERQARILGRRVVFWLAWVFANAVGYLACLMVGETVLAIRSPNAAIAWFGLVLAPLAPGVLQGLVLRWRASRVGLWGLANAFGFLLGFFAPISNFIYYHPFSRLSSWILMDAANGIGMGAAIGILQGLVGLILRWRASQIVLWVFANAIGYAGGGVFGRIAGDLSGNRFGSNIGYDVGFTVGGAVVGAITGFALVWLLRYPSSPRGDSA